MVNFPKRMKHLIFFILFVSSSAFAQVLPRASIVYLANDTAITEQTLTGTPLQYRVGAGQTWQFEAVVYDSSSSSAGVEFGYFVTGAGSVTSIGEAQSTGSTATKYDIITADSTAGSATATAAGYALYVAHGTVVTTNAGKVVLTFLKATSGTAILKAGSYIKAQRIK